MSTQKSILIEKLGVHLEQTEQLAPVASRVLATLILTGQKGTTFEELVTDICASKSTISTHLTHLQTIKRVDYYTKQGDRKKYFVPTKCGLIERMGEMLDNWTEEKQLHLDIIKYKTHRNEISENESDKFDLEFHNDYLIFLEQAESSISKLKEKMNKKINNE